MGDSVVERVAQLEEAVRRAVDTLGRLRDENRELKREVRRPRAPRATPRTPSAGREAGGGRAPPGGGRAGGRSPPGPPEPPQKTRPSFSAAPRGARRRAPAAAVRHYAKLRGRRAPAAKR